MKWIAFFLLWPFFHPGAAAAQCASSSRLGKVALSWAVLEEFVNPAKNPSFTFVALPLDPCVSVNSNLEITEPSGRAVGQFVWQEKWEGPFDTRSLAAQPKSIAVEFRNLLRSRGLTEYDAAEVLVRLASDKVAARRDSSVRLLKGRMRLAPGYSPSRWEEGKGKPNVLAKVISYPELIAAIGRPETVILDATQTPRDKNLNWRVPKSLQVSRMSVRDPPRRFQFSELVNYWRVADRAILPKDLNARIIVYSYPHAAAATANIVEWLRLFGYQNISWFAGGAVEWNDRPSGLQNRMDEFDLISAADLKGQTESDRFLILDVRDKYEYDQGHLKGAVIASLKAYSAKVVPQQYRSVKPAADGIYHFVDYRFTAQDKGKLIVIYGADEEDPRVLQAARVVLQGMKVKPRIYLDGFADWRSRNQWLGPAAGFDVEISKTNPVPKPSSPRKAR